MRTESRIITREDFHGLPLRFLAALIDNRWLFLLRGFLAALFGALACGWPGLTLEALALFFGVFALSDGVLAAATAFRGVEVAACWWLALGGVASIAVGVSTL